MRLFQAFLRRYARGEARVLAPHVIGPRLLDLGAGEGWVGEAVHMLTPAWTCAVDVGPFRLAKGPYAIYDGTRLPFAEDTFDTTLISFVLHHCERPEAVFAEAVRVTRARLLVIESVYRTRVEHFWLHLLDRQLNRHRHDGRMNVPLAFRRPEEWNALFESHSLRVVAMEWLGSWVERLVHHPLLFAMDKGPATSGVDHGRTGQDQPVPMGPAGGPGPPGQSEHSENHADSGACAGCHRGDHPGRVRPAAPRVRADPRPQRADRRRVRHGVARATTMGSAARGQALPQRDLSCDVRPTPAGSRVEDWIFVLANEDCSISQITRAPFDPVGSAGTAVEQLVR